MTEVVIVGQVGTMGAASQLGFRGGFGSDTRAAIALDARPVAHEEGCVEQPSPMFAGVFVRQPLAIRI